MNNRLIGFALVAMAVLFGIKLLPVFQALQPHRYLAPNDVRGIEVVHGGRPFTLNFEQQNKVIAFLNESKPTGENLSPTAGDEMPVSKILVYRFEASPLELRVLAYGSDNNLIFSAPVWNRTGDMTDMSRGAMKKLLAQTFDP